MSYIKSVVKGFKGWLIGSMSFLVANQDYVVSVVGEKNALFAGALVGVVSALLNLFKHLHIRGSLNN